MNLVSVSLFKWKLIIQKFKRKFLRVEIGEILVKRKLHCTVVFLDINMPNLLTISSVFPYLLS